MCFIKNFLLSFSLLCIFLFSNYARALSFGMDFSITGTDEGYHLKNHTFLMLNLSSNIAFGPVVFLERPETFFLEGIGGVGIRIGKSKFIEIGGGYYSAHGKNQNGTFDPRGFAAFMVPGIAINGFRISVPITIKRTERGIAQKWDTEILPYVGIEF